jgi:hypothetical protein
VIDVADRLREAVRSEPFDLVEGELGTGRDDEVIVVEHRAVAQFELARLRMHALHPARIEADALLLEVRSGREFDVAALSPVDRDPRIRRHEMEVGTVADDGDAIAPA